MKLELYYPLRLARWIVAPPWQANLANYRDVLLCEKG